MSNILQTSDCRTCGSPNRLGAKFCTTCRSSLYGRDIFISHASEDKAAIVRPLAQELANRGLQIWLDEHELTIGDSLRRKIDEGLANSRFGAVILSPDFFRKEWPQKELDALVARDDGLDKVILPIWHNLTSAQVMQYSPLLASKLAISTSRGINAVADAILKAMQPLGVGGTSVAPSNLRVERLGTIRARLFVVPDTWQLLQLQREVEAYLHDYPNDVEGVILLDQVKHAIQRERIIHPPTAVMPSPAPHSMQPSLRRSRVGLACVVAIVLILTLSIVAALFLFWN